jgi:hypothetical protein
LGSLSIQASTEPSSFKTLNVKSLSLTGFFVVEVERFELTTSRLQIPSSQTV